MKSAALRKWLHQNKIFFEVIVASLLSFMAVYVSIQANRIAENQTRIMEQENLPQLEIRKTQEFNDLSKLYDNNIWYFFNRGGRLSDFDMKDYSFYTFTYKDEALYDSVSFPLYSYLNMRGTLTGESEGLIYQVDNNRNGAHELKLRDSLRAYGFDEIETYAAISYTDIFDERHTEYFRLNPQISRISKREWDIAEAKFDSSEKYTFPKLQATDVIKMINKKNQ